MKNVILITLDATRKDVFSIYGNDKGLSPFIDSLKNKSLIFNNCYSTGPYTQASFPGILTSSHYLDYGRPNNSALDPRRTVISEPLQKAGITTAGFHSNPYCSNFFGWDRGWDKFYDSMEEDLPPRMPYIQGPRVNEMTFNWLKSPQGGKSGNPFFLWVHYMDIHEPYNPEQKYIDMVHPEIKITQDEMAELQQKVVLKRDVSDPKTVELLKKLYEVHVREVDGYVKDLFGTLENEGILKDTVVIITADHGDEFNDHGALSHDHKGYNELVNVPLLIYGYEETGYSDTLVSTLDICPTIVNLFGLEPVPAFKGASLLPQANFEEKAVFGEAIDQKAQRGGDINIDVYYLREGDFKIIYTRYLDKWELYDLKADPGEKNNIADTSPKFNEMKEKILPMVRRWEK